MKCKFNKRVECPIKGKKECPIKGRFTKEEYFEGMLDEILEQMDYLIPTKPEVGLMN